MTTRTKIRESNLELLRLLSMFLIVWFHSAFHGTHLGIEGGVWSISNAQGTPNQLFIEYQLLGGGTGVNCFILITGYYMVKSRITLRKLLKLWVQVLSYSLGLYLGLVGLAYFAGYNFSPSFSKLLRASTPIVHYVYWFISVYFLLILISPYLNRLLLSLNKSEARRFVILLTALVACIPNIFPQFAMGGELAWFVLLYSISAYIRLHVDMEKEHSAKWLAIAGGILFVILSGVTINYLMRELYPENIQSRIRELFLRKEGIMTLLLSVSMFMTFASWKLGCKPYLNTLAAGTLGVYLLHDYGLLHSLIWNKLCHMEEMLNSIWYPAHSLRCSLLVFSAGLLIDAVRRLLFRWVSTTISYFRQTS